MSPSAAERPYITITGDTHAGAAIDMYREYLDPASAPTSTPGAAQYRNPSKKLLGTKKTKNWDSAERRADLESDGVVARGDLPEHRPAVLRQGLSTSLRCAKPEQYPRWLAGTRAHNRWLADFCAEEPQRRAGIGLIHLNDVDDAIEDVEVDRRARPARRRAAAAAPPSTTCTSQQLTLPQLRPALGGDPGPRARDESALGAGQPALRRGRGRQMLWVLEMPFFVQRGFMSADHVAVSSSASRSSASSSPSPAARGRPACCAAGRRAHGHEGRRDGRGRHVARSEPLARDAELLRAPQLLVRRELPVARRRRRAATTSASTGSSGATTTRTTRAATRTRARTCASPTPTWTRRKCA